MRRTTAWFLQVSYPEDAKIHAASIVASAPALLRHGSESAKPTTFFEVFGRGSIVKAAACARWSLNLNGLRATDLRTMRDDGTPWDFSKNEHRHDARRLQSSEKPAWLIGSLPCTLFSIWNVGKTSRRWTHPKLQQYPRGPIPLELLCQALSETDCFRSNVLA